MLSPIGGPPHVPYTVLLPILAAVGLIVVGARLLVVAVFKPRDL